MIGRLLRCVGNWLVSRVWTDCRHDWDPADEIYRWADTGEAASRSSTDDR